MINNKRHVDSVTSWGQYVHCLITAAHGVSDRILERLDLELFCNNCCPRD